MVVSKYFKHLVAHTALHFAGGMLLLLAFTVASFVLLVTGLGEMPPAEWCRNYILLGGVEVILLVSLALAVNWGLDASDPNNYWEDFWLTSVSQEGFGLGVLVTITAPLTAFLYFASQVHMTSHFGPIPVHFSMQYASEVHWQVAAGVLAVSLALLSLSIRNGMITLRSVYGWRTGAH